MLVLVVVVGSRARRIRPDCCIVSFSLKKLDGVFRKGEILDYGGRGIRVEELGGREEKRTIDRPSVNSPTVFKRGEVTPPTMGRPLVVSSTVFRRLLR